MSLLCFLLFPQSGLDKLHGGLKAKIVILPLVSCQFHIYCYVNVKLYPHNAVLSIFLAGKYKSFQFHAKNIKGRCVVLEFNTKQTQI